MFQLSTLCCFQKYQLPEVKDKMKILNFGSLNLDFVYRVPHFVRAGETLSSTAYQQFCGGKGLNQSVALSLAGAEVYHAGVIGKGGEILKETLEKYGVNTDLITAKECMNGHAVIQVDEEGQNCIMLYGGSNQSITEDYVDRVLSNFSAGDILVLQNEINKLDYTISSAWKRGIKIALNPSPIDKKLFDLPLKYIHWFLLNEIEGSELSGEKESTSIVNALVSHYPDSAFVLTLGKDGVLYKDAQQLEKHSIYQVSVKDTTAAGDTFTGYFIACIAQGLSVGEALEKASVASSIAVSRYGAAVSIPSRSEVDNHHLVMIN